jgi:hypothetical protein
MYSSARKLRRQRRQHQAAATELLVGEPDYPPVRSGIGSATSVAASASASRPGPAMAARTM